jgi:hypothetical protein
MQPEREAFGKEVLQHEARFVGACCSLSLFAWIFHFSLANQPGPPTI